MQTAELVNRVSNLGARSIQRNAEAAEAARIKRRDTWIRIKRRDPVLASLMTETAKFFGEITARVELDGEEVLNTLKPDEVRKDEWDGKLRMARNNYGSRWRN